MATGSRRCQHQKLANNSKMESSLEGLQLMRTLWCLFSPSTFSYVAPRDRTQLTRLSWKDVTITPSHGLSPLSLSPSFLASSFFLLFFLSVLRVVINLVSQHHTYCLTVSWSASVWQTLSLVQRSISSAILEFTTHAVLHVSFTVQGFAAAEITNDV